MKQLLRRASIVSVAAAMLATSAIAIAQPNNYPGQRDDRQQGRHAQQGGAHGQGHANRHGYRPEPPRAQGPQHRPGSSHMQGHRGAGPDRSWQRGSRMPAQYRTRHYVVNDWRGHHLSSPPRGYHWVQNGSDYLLVAIATGVIAQLILSN